MRVVGIVTLLTIGLFSACSKDKAPPPMTPAAGTVQAIDKLSLIHI